MSVTHVGAGDSEWHLLGARSGRPSVVTVSDVPENKDVWAPGCVCHFRQSWVLGLGRPQSAGYSQPGLSKEGGTLPDGATGLLTCFLGVSPEGLGGVLR